MKRLSNGVSSAWLTLLLLVVNVNANDLQLHSFDRQQLTDVYFSEGANAGDINHDGVTDIVYGPYWFAGPDYKQQHQIYPPVPQDRTRYADNFFSWIYDFNGDGWNDVLVVGFPGTPAYVYENPQADGLNQHWKKHQVFDWVSNESPQLTDIVGDPRPELICTRDGFFGFVTVDWDDPFGSWDFHPISAQITDKRFGHGLGVGDVNGDGRMDVITAKGWFEQPETNALNSRWKHHEVSLSTGYGGAEMYAYDVDGDGDNDIITGHRAHEFGLAWYEQIAEAGEIAFKHHLIMGEHPSENKYGVVFSEPHSINLADIDGDGLADIVTGKTYWSHHKQSPMWDAGAVVYWFKLVRTETGIDWIPYQADGEAGIGRQLSVADVNSDGLPDLIVGGMKGAHVLTHQVTAATEQQWQAAQPKIYTADKPISSANPAASRGSKSPIDAATKRVPGAIEGESLRSQVSRGQARPQVMTPFRGDRWSGQSQLWWTGGRPGDVLAVELPEFEGIVDVEVVLTCAGDYGVVQLSLDEQPLGKPIDLYDRDVITTGVLSFPQMTVKPGTHQLTAQLTGINPSAKKAFMFGLDYIRVKLADGSFLSPPPTAANSPEVALLDEYPHAGLDAEQAAAAMKLPEGFQVTVGAAEPAVKQPIAMAIDDRGRVWIAEAYEYPIRAKGDQGRDRILIFEDTDGNGSLDKRLVFAEGLNLVSGLEVGFGGVWVGAAPYLLFIPDKDGDDLPDSEPQILLDGWGFQDTHETLNAFIWGPDGWLYGCHGVFTHSRVGKPGTSREDRTRLNAGVWRYHPTRHQFEVFAHGTSNPWGVDFNDHGQAFITACVIPHLYHMIQGGRYHRQGGIHFNPYTYRDIVTIADHLHYLGATPHSGNSRSDAAGGGHAHAGAMIYLGDRWPQQYRDQLFMNNIHGQRLNVDVLKTNGSGYVGSHGPDFLLTGDQASQILNLRYGPDGDAWMIDWYDMQACHERQSTKHDRSNGRIYKISYGDAKAAAPPMNLSQLSDTELAELMLHQNDWYVRHARRLLQERTAERPLDAGAVARLIQIAGTHTDDTRRLRAAWALHVSGGISTDLRAILLADPSPYVRGWAIQLAMESTTEGEQISLVDQLVRMGGQDQSPIVRLYLASAAQRIPANDRWSLLQALTGHPEDAGDHNLPLMYWYAAEPLAEVDETRALALAISAGEAIPLLREFMLRRIGSSDSTSSLAVLVKGLGEAESSTLQESFLKSIRAALQGQRQVAAPDQWATVSARLLTSQDPNVRLLTYALGVTFGDQAAQDAMRSTLAEGSSDTATRLFALQSLLDAKAPSLVATLESLLSVDGPLREASIRGLAQYDDESIATALIAQYPDFTPDQKRMALGTLCSRSRWAIELLRSIDGKQIAGTDLTADLVRQLQLLKNEAVDSLLHRVWGTARESAADKLAIIADYRRLIETPSLEKPDPQLGRAVFAKTCMKCHRLYGVGYQVGPDLTGSNRANLDYLLSNIVDPSAVLAKEYRPTNLLTTDGRVVSGLIKAEDSRSISLQTADALVLVAKQDVEQRSESDTSMMPDDQLKQFSQHEIRSLVAYLRGDQQTPMLATSENAQALFNGRDLSGWSGTEGLWSVEAGELVGRSAGLSRNEWLVSDLAAENFRLTLEVKLVDNAGNSGIQFRSQAHGGEVSGYQADIGKGWWGKLYEEHGRGLLWNKPATEHVKPGDWNQYQIVAQGSHIQTFINGQLCVDFDDPDWKDAVAGPRGIFAFQLHSGGKTEVRFRNVELQVLDRQISKGSR